MPFQSNESSYESTLTDLTNIYISRKGKDFLEHQGRKVVFTTPANTNKKIPPYLFIEKEIYPQSYIYPQRLVPSHPRRLPSLPIETDGGFSPTNRDYPIIVIIPLE